MTLPRLKREAGTLRDADEWLKRSPIRRGEIEEASSAFGTANTAPGVPRIEDLAVAADGHWPAALRRARRLKLENERFAESRHSMWSEAELRRLGSRHDRVRDETYDELRQRAAQQQVELEQLEARHKQEAKTIAALSDQLQHRLAAEKLPPKEAALGALLQQALIHGVDGELLAEEIVIRVQLSAAGLATGLGGLGLEMEVREPGEVEEDVEMEEPPPPPNRVCPSGSRLVSKLGASCTPSCCRWAV